MCEQMDKCTGYAFPSGCSSADVGVESTSQGRVILETLHLFPVLRDNCFMSNQSLSPYFQSILPLIGC